MDLPQHDSMSQDLSKALKETTKEVYTQAENAKFLRNIQKDQVTRNGFNLVMASLYNLYVALKRSSATGTTLSMPPSTSQRNCTARPP